MKITGDHIQGISQVNLNQVKKVQQTAKTEVPQAADSVELSSDVGAIDAARAAIANAPDVRTEKVEALRRQIADGTYQVDAQGIAAKLLTEMRLSKLADK